MSDAEVAKQTGHPLLSVKNTRCKFGIPIFNPTRRAWTQEEAQMLVSLSDEEIARRTGRSVGAIRFRRRALGSWSPEEEKLLGTGPDDKIAAQLDRSVAAVITRRRMLRLPRYNPKENRVDS
jgi:hypothetical protein